MGAYSVHSALQGEGTSFLTLSLTRTKYRSSGGGRWAPAVGLSSFPAMNTLVPTSAQSGPYKQRWLECCAGGSRAVLEERELGLGSSNLLHVFDQWTTGSMRHERRHAMFRSIYSKSQNLHRHSARGASRSLCGLGRWAQSRWHTRQDVK